MVSTRSLRLKSSSVLRKLKRRIASKPKNSVGVQELDLRQTAASSRIDTARTRTRRSNTSENKRGENRSSKALARKSKIVNQEDSRVKSCTVLAVKLKYPYVSRTTSVKLNSRSSDRNSRSPNKNSRSPNRNSRSRNRNSSASKALPRKTVKLPETDLDDRGASRRSSRTRKPTNKELRSILISTDDTKLGLEKHNGEISPQKPRRRSVKPQISNDTSIPDQNTRAGKVGPSGKKVMDDMECVRCGLTPSQFFGRDAEHNTVCCICSLVEPPQGLKALLQLLKLDCCLNVLNKRNQNALKSNNTPSRKRRMSGHISKAVNENAASGNNSVVKTLRERSSVRAQKEHNQSSLEDQKQNTTQFTRPVRQQRGNSSMNLNKLSNATKSPDSGTVSNTRVSRRLSEKALSQLKSPAKANTQRLSSGKDIHRNLKRKISPTTTQTPAKRRKLTETVEVKEHICTLCNSTFAIQWKLKLHELSHSDKSHPNVVLRHVEIKNRSDVTVMDCVPDSENTADKDSLNEQVSDPAEQQTDIIEKLQEGTTISDNESPMEDGDDLEHPQTSKHRDEVGSVLEGNEEIINSSSVIQSIQISDASTNENTDLYDMTANCDTPSDKDNIEVNEESDAPITCEENPTCSNSTNQSVKAKEDEISEKPDLSSNFDTNSLGTHGHIKDKEQVEIKSNEIAGSKREKPKENESMMEESNPLDTVSDEDTAVDQSEIQNTVKGLAEVEEVEVEEENENNMGSQESVKVIAETETCELNKTNEDKHAGEENESNEESEESMKEIGETETHELSEINEDEHAGEENENTDKIYGNTAGEKAGLCQDDEEYDSSKMDENCSKESVSLKSTEQKDVESVVIEKESNFENTANECSKLAETEIKSKHNHDDQHKADGFENKEKKVNGTAAEDDDDADDEDEDDDDEDDGSKNVFESENPYHTEVVTHAVDDISQHPVDENMAELYNQMNKMFEGEPDEDKTAKTEPAKKSSDYLGNGNHFSEPNDQNRVQ